LAFVPIGDYFNHHIDDAPDHPGTGRTAALEARQEKAAKYRGDILPLNQEHQKRGVVTFTALAAATELRRNLDSLQSLSR